MDTVFSFILLFLFTITITYTFLISLHSKRHKLPPGPRGLPIVGNLPQLGQQPHQTMASLAKIHGPIMSLKLGQVTTIVMSSSETAKQVLQIHDQFLPNRKIPDSVRAANHDQYCLPFLPISHRWRDLRKICNNLLFSNKTLDASGELRRKKVLELFNDIHESMLKSEVVDIGRLVFKTTINLLSNTIYSEDLIHSVDKAGEFKEVVANIMREVGRPNLADFFPVLKVIDPHGIRRRTGSYFWKLLTIFKGLVDQRVKLRKQSGYCTKNDMLDALLENVDAEEMYKDKIERLSLDLFVAGNDTVTTMVEWTMAELFRNPDVMSRAKAELEQTVGKCNMVEESDIGRLPYLNAIVKETFRLHPTGPLLLPRKGEVDLEINGYIVPKGAEVLVNVWAIGRDPNLWVNPNVFSPERFLGSEIDFKGRSFELIPFGAGRRICPGLPLAIRLLFLMLGLLINCFDWELEGGIKPKDMNMEEKFGLTLQKAQPVRVVPIKIKN